MIATFAHPLRPAPGPEAASAVHLVWSFVVLPGAVHFWWWEFALREGAVWHVGLYIFVLVYAVLQFLLAALLYPAGIAGYTGFGDDFISRRRWFFGIFAPGVLLDIVDTWTRGARISPSSGRNIPSGWASASSSPPPARSRPGRVVAAGPGLLWLVYDLSWIVRHDGVLQD